MGQLQRVFFPKKNGGLPAANFVLIFVSPPNAADLFTGRFSAVVLSPNYGPHHQLVFSYRTMLLSVFSVTL